MALEIVFHAIDISTDLTRSSCCLRSVSTWRRFLTSSAPMLSSPQPVTFVNFVPSAFSNTGGVIIIIIIISAFIALFHYAQAPRTTAANRPAHGLLAQHVLMVYVACRKPPERPAKSMSGKQNKNSFLMHVDKCRCKSRARSKFPLSVLDSLHLQSRIVEKNDRDSVDAGCWILIQSKVG